MKETKIGNIVFGKNGILFEKPYSKNDCPLLEQCSYEDVRTSLLALCARRMTHCRNELELHAATAKYCSEHAVVWDTGHFSLPVYQMLEDFVASNGSKVFCTSGILQQCIRELLRNGSVGAPELAEFPDVQKAFCEDHVSTASVKRWLTDVMLANMPRDLNLPF